MQEEIFDRPVEYSSNLASTRKDVLSAVPEYLFLADFLGFKGPDIKHNMPHLEEIWQWAESKTGKKDKLAVASTVKNLIRANGWRSQGQLLTKEMFRWVRLDLDRQRIQAEQKLYQNKGGNQ